MASEDLGVATPPQASAPVDLAGCAVKPSEGVTAAHLACLRAAKRGLIREWSASGRLCPMSAHPDYGWFAQSNWSERRGDWLKGGPWSVERIAELCELGFLGVDPKDNGRAVLTADGKRRLKASQTTPQDASGEKASTR